MSFRTRHGRWWWAQNLLVLGISLGAVGNAVAQSASPAIGPTAWEQPSTVLAIVAMIFAGGQMWGARLEDRRKLNHLEEAKASKESVIALKEGMDRSERKMDAVLIALSSSAKRQG